MKINELGPKQYYPEIQKPAEQSDQVKGTPKPEKGKPKSIDKVEVAGVTKQSKETARLFHLAKSKLQQVSDVRYDKLQAARKKIENGEYNRPEVLNALAEKLAKNPEIRAALGGIESNTSMEGLSPQRMEVIRNRVKSGYYNRPEVVDKIADSLLTHLDSEGENNS